MKGWLLDSGALTRFLHPVHGGALTARLLEQSGREGLSGRLFTSAMAYETLMLRAQGSFNPTELSAQLRRVFSDIAPLPYERGDADALTGFPAAREKGADLAALRFAAQAKARSLTLVTAKPQLYEGLEGVKVEAV